MLTLTVSGMFKELNSGHKIPPLRYFFKTLVIVPAGSGFCISNEEVHISNATPDQAKVSLFLYLFPFCLKYLIFLLKEAFKTPITVPNSPQTSVESRSSPTIVTSPTQNALNESTKHEMVNQLSIQSGMNLEWSLK